MTDVKHPRIIAFTGPKTSGKDTMAYVLLKQNSKDEYTVFKRMPFAAPVKEICSLVFGWDERLQDAPAFKETPTVEWPQIEPRWLMMEVGNWFREKYGEDVWLNVMKRRVREDMEQPRPAGAYVITDLRFPNELAWLKQQNALIIYVERALAEERLEKAKKQNDAKALNPSEAHYALMKAEADIIIDNNGTVRQGQKQVVRAVRNKFGQWQLWPIRPYTPHPEHQTKREV